MLAYPKDFIEDAILLVLNHPPVVDERANPKTLIFTTTTLQELVSVGPNERYGSRGRGRSEGGFLSILERRPLLSRLVKHTGNSKCLEVPTAVSAY